MRPEESTTNGVVRMSLDCTYILELNVCFDFQIISTHFTNDIFVQVLESFLGMLTIQGQCQLDFLLDKRG